jgi:hypothetical protein
MELTKNVYKNIRYNGNISGSHGGKYEDGCLLGYAV